MKALVPRKVRVFIFHLPTETMKEASLGEKIYLIKSLRRREIKVKEGKEYLDDLSDIK